MAIAKSGLHNCQPFRDTAAQKFGNREATASTSRTSPARQTAGLRTPVFGSASLRQGAILE